MPHDTNTVLATTIAVVGSIVTVVGAAVSLYNSRKTAQWKRAELANNYLKEFNQNDELVFFGRCLDWDEGQLVVPEKLQPLAPCKTYIYHERNEFVRALLDDLECGDHRGVKQIYRTACDGFLTWLCLIGVSLERELFTVDDIRGAHYWITKMKQDRALHAFIKRYYEVEMRELVGRFSMWARSGSDWLKPYERHEYPPKAE